jgi:hypothetical protein
MLNPIYSLPKIDFIGGESHTFKFRLVTPTRESFDANGCTMAFSIINYANQNGEPLVIKGVALEIGEDGVPNIAVVHLLPEDTVELSGRYAYQISIRDTFDEVELPGKGLFDITRNIHRRFITH